MAVFELSRPALRRCRIREILPTDHPPILDQLGHTVDQLPDPTGLTGEQMIASMTQIARLRNRLDAYLTGLAGAADAQKVAQTHRAGTTGTLLATATTADPATGSALVATARALHTLPHVDQAYRRGLISAGHVSALRHAAAHIHGFADLEQALVDLATTIEPRELRRLLDLLIAQSAPDTAERRAADQHDKRGLSLSETPTGMYRLDGWLDALEGRRLADTLAGLDHHGGPADTRTPRQRRADALADLISAARAASRPYGVSGLSILVDLNNLPDATSATLDDSHPLTPTHFDLHACAVVASIIFGTYHNTTFIPLALGRTHRRATAGQWAALIARDHGCIHCGRIPQYCEAHHIVHWKNGGLTDLDNLVLLCSRCHHDLHFGLYTITIDTHGVPHITSTRAPPQQTRAS